MNLSKQGAKQKLLGIKDKYNLTDNEKQAIDKGIKGLSCSQDLATAIKNIQDLPIIVCEDGTEMISYKDVMYYLSKIGNCRYDG